MIVKNLTRDEFTKMLVNDAYSSFCGNYEVSMALAEYLEEANEDNTFIVDLVRIRSRYFLIKASENITDDVADIVVKTPAFFICENK